MRKDFSRSNLITLFALICRVAVGAGSVLLVSIVAPKDVFGEYSTVFSVVTILGAVLDFGVSLSTLTYSRSQESELSFVRSLIVKRDCSLFAILLISALFVTPNQFVVILSAVLSGHVLSVQAYSRASGGHLVELFINALMCICILAAYFSFSRHIWAPDLWSLSVGFIVVPKLVAFAVCAAYIAVARTDDSISAQLKGQRDLTRLIPFALQGVLVASAANLDVIAASRVMSMSDVGAVKLVTTYVGLFIIFPEMLANIWINKLANMRGDDSSFSRFRTSFRKVGLALSVISYPIFLVLIGRGGGTGFDFIAALCLSLVVAIRVECLAAATIFSLSGFQKHRIKIMLTASVLYWGGLMAFGGRLGIAGFFIAYVASAVFQLFSYIWYDRPNGPLQRR